ncbi:MAG: F0F1 ATP synthase subunit B [Thermodesulfobacteriota bacterium]
MIRRIAGLALTFCLVLFLAGPGPAWSQEHGPAAPSEEGHGQEGGGLVTKAKLVDLLVRFINFLVLFGVLFYILRKPIGKFFSGRRADIARDLEEFERKKKETEAGLQEIEGKLAEIAAERERLLADYLKEGEEEKAKIIAHAHEMAERIKKQAEMTIEQEIKSAKAELIREIADLSAALAEELVKKNINEDDQKRLVKEYIEKVVRN